MKIIKKSHETLIREDAHGGSGSRKVLLSDREISNVQGLTYGFLPAGSKFVWHTHEKMNETMLVLKGHGTARDEDDIYQYNEGDLFIFPEGVYHEIENTSEEESEYIFVRIYK
ncbi:MAG: cupin domain-containing protein [Candidatus Pacebacteria bacterium]|nr:cupin domain-containing protein [Candidatus Paceibacterota bacterium]MBP9715921.1 cupin domain-containing protein [Candidatus Paceibacterota bacterium]